MAKKIYTADELNKCDKETLAAIIPALQDQVETLNQNMEKLIEQIAAANNHRYGQKSEKMDTHGLPFTTSFPFLVITYRVTDIWKLCVHMNIRA